MKEGYKVGWGIIIVCIIILIVNYNPQIKKESINLQQSEKETVLLNLDDIDFIHSIRWNQSYDKPDYKLVITIDGNTMTKEQFRDWANQTIDIIENYNYTFNNPIWSTVEIKFGDALN